MPTYEFSCPQGHDFEKLYRTISGAESQAECPQCGQVANRIMSAAGFAFKGSGFYLTDYGKDAHRKKGPAEANSDGANSDGGKADGAKADGAKADGAKADGAKADSAKTDGAGSPKSESSGGGDKPKSESKPAESKPAPAPPKPSSGE